MLKSTQKIFWMLILCFVGTNAQTHPFLYFGSGDLTSIRSRATTSGTAAFQIWNDVILNSQIDLYRAGSNINYLTISSWDQENVYAFALAYVITQDATYLNDVRRVLWGGTNIPVGLLSQPYNSDWNGSNRVVALSMVYDLLYNDFTSNERDQIKTVIMSDINNGLRPFIYDQWQSTYAGNHIAIRASSLGIAAIALHGDAIYPEAGTDIEYIKNRLLLDSDSYLKRLFSEGACHEGVGYGLAALNKLLPFIQILSRYENKNYFTDPNVQSKLQGISTWLAYEKLQNNSNIGYFNIINDTWSMEGDTQTLLSNLLVLAGIYQDGKAAWLFNNTVNNVSDLIPWPYVGSHWTLTPSIFLAFLLYDNVTAVNPGSSLEKAKLFKERGLAYVRTSSNWADNNDIQFGIEGHQMVNPISGYYSFVHTQSDKNHFVLNAFGDSFIRDYGYDSDRPEDHNYILIDDKGEAINPWVGSGQTLYALVGSSDLQMTSSPSYAFIHGNAKKAFDNLHQNSSASPIGFFLRGSGDPAFASYVNPLQNADRFVMFNQPEGSVPAYIIVGDDINKDNSTHTYKWLFHSYSSATGTNPVTVAGNNGQLKVWSTAASAVTVSASTNSYLSTSAVNPYFHVVMVPVKTTAPTTPTPTVAMQTASNGSCFKITWSGYDDYSLFRYNSGTVSSSNLATDGKLMQVRKTTAGQVTSFSMGEGTSLTDNGTTLAQTYGTIATVMYSGTKVTINGDVSDFSVYAPNATTVEINGSSVNFIRAGNYIESSTISHNRTWGSTITLNFNTTIAAGVTLQFAPYTSLLCNAKLNVNGTAASPVVFTGSNWYGIVISGSGANSSQMNYATINNVLSYGGSALYITNANNVTISHCTITNNVNYGTTGIGLNNAGSPLISYNTISNNGGYKISYYNSSGDLWQNTFQNNPYGAIRLTNSSPTFGHNGVYSYNGNNTISGGSYGIYATNYSYPWVGSYGNTMVGYNSITGNTSARVYAATYSDVLAEQNWWGSSSPPSSWFQKDANSYIEYNPWLSSPPGQQGAALANNENIPMTAAQNVSEMNVDDFWKIREAIAFGKPEQAVEMLSAIAKNGKSKEIFDRIFAESVILLQSYPENENVRVLITLLQDKASQSNLSKINLGRLYALTDEHTKAIQLFHEAKGNDDSKMEFKLAGIDEFFVNLSNNNINDAELNLSELQKHFKDDEDVKGIAWMYELIKGGANENNNQGGSRAVANNATTNFGLDNFPNPFNPSTTISFTLPADGFVSLKVYDILGRELQTLANDFKHAGSYQVSFNAQYFSSGLYFYRLEYEGKSIIRKMLLTK